MKYLVKNKYWNIVEDYNIDKLLYLLIDRPDFITASNNFIWKNSKNQKHRNYDLPAAINKDYDIVWCKNNVWHRKNNKPTIIRLCDSKEYWLNDGRIK